MAVAAVVETVVFAAGAGEVAGVPVEETEAGEACAGAVAVAVAVAGSVSGGALVDAEAVVGAVAVAGVGAAAAPEAGEGASGLGDRLNAGYDAGDCGKHAAGWPLWMPPFSSATKRHVLA